MLSPRLRERLSRLARGLASEPDPEGAPSTTPPRAPDSPSVPAFPTNAAQPWFLHYDPAGSSAPLVGPDGCCLAVEPDLALLLADHGARVDAWRSLAAEVWGPPEARLYVDIETAGLAAAPLFLIGTLALESGRLRLRQFLARDYTEESPLLQHFFPWSARYERLITFNGQTFDLPFLLDRAIYHRLAAGLAQAHTDLLPLARRQWRHRTPDCRLATLETYLCGHQRVGDVAGADIPNLYHQFVRTPQWDLLAPVLHHNALDLLTMADLAAMLGEERS
jgi:hypothetical protein